VATQRSTFREVQEGVAWQKALRDRYLAEGTPPVEHLDLGRAVVRRVSRAFAEHIILKYEWLGTMAPTSVHYGIFFGDACAGVTCVGVNGVGTAGALKHKEFGIERSEFCTLARGACVHWAPTGTNSKLVAWTIRLLGKETKSKTLIAYADTDAGEIGTIYQACNWVYLGRTMRRPELVSPHGRALNIKLLGDLAKQNHVPFAEMRKALEAKGWKLQPSNTKHKYIAILDKKDRALVERIEGMRLPYPKRGDETRGESKDGVAPGHQPGEGGSIPTSPLQDLPKTTRRKRR